ncbi:MAG: hypothetical protein EPN93_05620 [Spirochaetes bacterium]|nr:MAG: hypothetical protein EPN93_05620 [Spirochaetota bacterium]
MKIPQIPAVLLALCAAFLLPAFPGSAGAQELKSGDVVWGARAGYSHLSGYWQRELTDAPYFGLYQDFLIRDRVMAETDISYASYPLENSGTSKIHSLAFAAGPLWHYPLAPWARLYAGLSLQGVFFAFDSDTYGKRDYAFKPGGMLKAGVFIPVRQSLGLRVGAELTSAPLSGKAFTGINFVAGASFNYNAFERAVTEEGIAARRDDPRAAAIESLYADSVKRFEEGDIAAAKEGFTGLDRQAAHYRDADRFLALIAAAESSLAQGKRFLDEARYYEAITPLSEAAKYSGEARTLLKNARERLAAEIPALEQMGVAAYERGEYELCIAIMKKIQAVDPDNRVMVIYLPRAQKRYEGLQKLR